MMCYVSRTFLVKKVMFLNIDQPFYMDCSVFGKALKWLGKTELMFKTANVGIVQVGSNLSCVIRNFWLLTVVSVQRDPGKI